jgi:hypothetical protein
VQTCVPQSPLDFNRQNHDLLPARAARSQLVFRVRLNGE